MPKSENGSNRPDQGGVDPHVAARTAVDPDALLDGEDPRTKRQDDVRHWITAYTELVDYKERLLATSARDRSTMETEAARQETAEVDIPILRTELDRYRRRLQFWQKRSSELGQGA
jgi:hypothetical protein